MKAQEVILKAAAGKLKWWEAAEVMGVTDRTMRRWRERLQEHGYSGLWDYRKRQPSPKRVPMATVEQVLHLYRERYFDFNVRYFHEKLGEEHDLQLSYGWVSSAADGRIGSQAQEAGIASQAAAAASCCGNDAAYRWQ